MAIPLRDEEASVETLLDSLLAQSRPPDQIVIADGGSRDRTVERVQARIDAGQPIRLVEIGPAFPGRARNAAVRASDCEWIAFTDGGIRVERDWLARLAGYVEARPETDLVLGGFEPITPSFFTRCAAIAYVPQRRDGWRGVFVASSLIRRSLFDQIGGFPEHLRSAEDLIFLERAQALARHVGVVPGALVHWQLQPDAQRTLRRFRTYARYGLIAGRYGHWHRAIMRRYALLAGASVLTGPAAPLVFPSLVAGQLVARAVLSMARKPEFVEPGVVAGLRQVAVTSGIVGLLDYAAFHGLVKWLLNDAARAPNGAG